MKECRNKFLVINLPTQPPIYKIYFFVFYKKSTIFVAEYLL